MTLAESMHLRFGVGREGNIAPIVSAVAAIILTIGSISYFAIAGGKFLGEFIAVDARLASILAVPLLLRWYWWRFNGYGFATVALA
ncbi:MAG: hypothetical protein MGF17_05310 [Trichodesmium sp. MAG_R04]|nr:hypothetical protein [Trichodesmium sp. MAG_R04]